MKRRRFFANILLFLFVIGGVFIPKIVIAEDCNNLASEVQRDKCFSNQATQNSPCASIASEKQRDSCFSGILLDGGIKIFTDQISLLQKPTASGKPSGVGFDFLIKSIQGSQQVFETYYKNNNSSGQTAAYREGMLRARNYLNNQRSAVGRPNEFNQEPISNFVLQFTNVLQLESSRADDTFFVTQQTGKTPAEASALVSARVDAASGRTGSAAKAVSEDASKPKSLCSIGIMKDMNLGACITEGVTWLIKNTFLEIAGFFAWAAANILNFSIKIGILDFAKWAPDTLYPIWIAVRQIISLIIVFVGLYLGFMYIIDRGKEFEKYIPWVVIFALFVNFSYPLTRTMIDVSNVVSLNIYTSAVGSHVLKEGTDGKNTAGAIIMNRLGLQGLLVGATRTGNEKVDGPDMLKNLNSVPAALVAVAFVFYAAYIFFVAAYILVIRTAALIFITVASPLLLVDAVLPVLGEKAAELRKLFFEQLIVGPVFMIMLALTLKFLEIFSQGDGPLAASVKGDTITVFFSLILMLIMLHIMITVTKKTSETLGKMTSGWVGKVGGFAAGSAAGLAMGGAGLLARGTIGRGAAALRESSWVKKQDGLMSRGVHRMSNSIANSTLDLRNSKVVAGQAGKLGMLGMGMGAKMGYSQNVEARQKAAVDGYNPDIYYKEDVLGKDKDGKTVVIHKQGDVDENAKKAQERYYEKMGGRSIFMTKEQKLKTQELLKAKSRENLSKEQAEIEKLAAENTKQYDSMKEGKVLPDGTVLTREKAKAERERIAKELTDELKELKKRDPYSANKETRALDTAVQKIKEQERNYLEADIVERQNFVKQAKAAFKEYKSIQDETKKTEFLGKQSKEIEEAVKKLEKGESLDAPTASSGSSTDEYREDTSSGMDHVDIDLTPTPTEEIASRREEKLKTATAQAQHEMAANAPKKGGEAGTAPVVAPTEPKGPSTGTGAENLIDSVNMFEI